MESKKEFWNIDAASGDVLEALIHTKKPMRILEVGTSNGYSAVRMGHVAKRYGGHITSIEFFGERVELARQNIRDERLSEIIEVLQGDAIEIMRNFSPSYEGEREGVEHTTQQPPPRQRAGAPPYPKGRNSSFDFIFLDANKEEYVGYFVQAMRLIRTNGIIVADNTISHAHKLSSFFEAVEHEPRASAHALTIGTGLLIITID
jgi:predicted O-methyltransferase YrrM